MRGREQIQLFDKFRDTFLTYFQDPASCAATLTAVAQRAPNFALR
jgi:hypothetical protein